MYVYYMPLISSTWNKQDFRLLNFVSPERQRRVLNYVHDSDRRLSLYAALLARRGLSKLTNIPHNQLSFDCRPNHKPRFLSAPGRDFSLSHTAGCILCCISSSGSVGADVEKIQSPPLQIMDMVFHPEEIRFIQNASPLQQPRHFYEIWTKKEAYTKRLGTGLAADLPAHNTLSPDLHPVFKTWIINNYMCCICGKNANQYEIIDVSEKDIHDYFLGDD